MSETAITSISRTAAPKKAFPAKEKPIFVVKIKCIPFGFFEKELWGFFNQFGTVLRARVARSKKTGNHKGWAYVGFDDKEVAEIAAETMNGYLMFEKRLLCHVMTTVPKCMKSGPRFVAQPHMKGQAKKAAREQNKDKTQEKEEKTQKKREASLAKQAERLKAMGVDYDMAAVPSYTSSVQKEKETVASTKVASKEKPTKKAKVGAKKPARK